MVSILPNLLTIARLLLIVPICLLVAVGGPVALWIATVFYILGAVTDWLDGYIARTFNAGSDFGKMLDPVVDKVFVAALFIMLAANGTVSGLWLSCPIIILAREFLVAGLRDHLGQRGIAVPVTTMAKWKTTVQMVAIGLLIVPLWPVRAVGFLLLLVATILTVITGAQYFAALKRAP